MTSITLLNALILTGMAVVLCGLFVCPGAAHAQGEADATPTVVSVRKIWDQGAHNAFTDLIRFKGQWYCSFREGDGHVGGDGKLRILVSDDGETWESAGFLGEKGIDLRDPKMSITTDGRLMIVAGGSVYKGKELLNRRPRVAFSADGRTWTAPQVVDGSVDGDWLWRVTWHGGKAYGCAYNIFTEDDWSLRLVSSDDGVSFTDVATLKVPDRANETTLRFLPSGQMIAFVRREAGTRNAWIGTSAAPYTDWTWHETGYAVGGPNFIVLPDGAMWAGARRYPGGAKAVLSRFGVDTYEPVLEFPSGGDCSYPGLVWHGGLLWVSYYSSHEGKTSIYLAKVRLTP
jgi:hypothetical protein